MSKRMRRNPGQFHLCPPMRGRSKEGRPYEVCTNLGKAMETLVRATLMSPTTGETYFTLLDEQLIPVANATLESWQNIRVRQVGPGGYIMNLRTVTGDALGSDEGRKITRDDIHGPIAAEIWRTEEAIERKNEQWLRSHPDRPRTLSDEEAKFASQSARLWTKGAADYSVQRDIMYRFGFLCTDFMYTVDPMSGDISKRSIPSDEPAVEIALTEYSTIHSEPLRLTREWVMVPEEWFEVLWEAVLDRKGA